MVIFRVRGRGEAFLCTNVKCPYMHRHTQCTMPCHSESHTLSRTCAARMSRMTLPLLPLSPFSYQTLHVLSTCPCIPVQEELEAAAGDAVLVRPCQPACTPDFIFLDAHTCTFARQLTSAVIYLFMSHASSQHVTPCSLSTRIAQGDVHESSQTQERHWHSCSDRHRAVYHAWCHQAFMRRVHAHVIIPCRHDHVT